jgi:hypothetical protein
MSITSTTIYPDWLPSLFVISPWTEHTFEGLYAIFKDDFLDNPANYCGHRVWLFPEKERNKETIFWHLTEREDKELACRVADPRRAERLPWGRPMLDNLVDPHILHGDYEEGDKTIKTYVWLKDFDYLIVLKRMPDLSRRLITSFYIEYSNKRRDLERKYKQML